MNVTVENILAYGSLFLMIGGVFIAWTNNRRDIKESAEAIATLQKYEENCPIEEVKTDVRWLKLILSSDTKAKRKDLWEHNSPLKLTGTAIALIPPDIKEVIDKTPGSYNTIRDHVYALPSLSENDLVKLAREKQMNVIELALIIDDYIETRAIKTRAKVGDDGR